MYVPNLSPPYDTDGMLLQEDKALLFEVVPQDDDTAWLQSSQPGNATIDHWTIYRWTFFSSNFLSPLSCQQWRGIELS